MLSAEGYTRLFNAPFFSSCTNESTIADQPTDIKVPLRQHQRAMIHAMDVLEKKLIEGYDISGERLYSRFAVLGDSVGVGKSLMVLGHIASNKNEAPLKTYNALNPYSNSNVFSLIQRSFNDISNSAALLVIPHILFRQWETYITQQTTLKPLLVKSVRTLQSPTFLKNASKADLILVSNTLLGKFLAITEHKLYYSRIYIDEADSIHIPSTQPFPEGSFIWFISASWANLMFESDRVWFPHSAVERITQSPEFNTYDILFQAQMLQALVGMRGYFTRYGIRSTHYFRDFVKVRHPHRTHLVLRCHDNFIAESISLPPMNTETILCEPTLAQRIVSVAVNAQVQSLLNAGDIQNALTALGVPADSPVNLIQAVTDNRTKELKRLRETYEFKATQEYATPQAKELALANLASKITSLEEQINSIRQRIENYKKEICAICYDEPQEAVLTPCCSRVFCGGCILTSLTRITGCPLCRTPLAPAALVSFSEKAPKKKKQPEPAGPPKKIDALMDLIKKHPNDKFLVFSRYENPFQMMYERLAADSVTVQTVKGSKDIVANLLTSFEEGKTRVLLLNAAHAGAGLNITAATYVVLWHAMTAEEEKQILGRAYRLGRKTPLNVVKLVHPDEVRS